MARDELQLLRALPEQLRRAEGDVPVRRAVEAVAPHPVLLIEGVGDTVEVRVLGHGLVEGRIEHGDLRNALPQRCAAGENARDIRRVVGERRTCLHRAQHVLVDQDGLGEALAAVDDAMADGTDLVHGGDDAVFRVGQRAQHLADRLGVGGHRQLLRVADGSAGQLRLIGKAAVKADALAQPLRQKHTRLRVEQLVLQRRASCVDYKYIHGCVSFSLSIKFSITHHECG